MSAIIIDSVNQSPVPKRIVLGSDAWGIIQQGQCLFYRHCHPRASFPSDPSAGSEGSEFMANTRSARDEITAAVTSWPGVHAVPGDLGELGFKLGRREIGHLHGDRAAHFSFPKKLWAELREQGRIVPHPVFPDSQGPAARSIEHDADVREVIALFRLNYDRAVARNGLAGEARGEGMNAKASRR